MNLLLLTAEDMTGPDSALIEGPRASHIRAVLKLGVGDTLSAGVLNGQMGRARIEAVSDTGYRLQLELNTAPPPKLPLTLLLALPRPKMLQRTLRCCAELGVARLVLMNTAKVEKSFWQSPSLAPEKMRAWMIDGLQQSKDTVLPELIIEKQYRDFIRQRLAALAADSRKLVAEPGVANACPVGINAATTLAIGPEGGFIPEEVAELKAAGFDAVHLGARILRVETAVPVLISRLFTA